MNWKDYLKQQGFKDEQIASMATTFGEDAMTKAFAGPVQQLADATKALADAKTERESFETFYNDEVLPKVSTVYQDAINARTQNAALEARLKAATDYGFLSDPAKGAPVVPGSPAGPPVTAVTPPNPGNPVPGSPAAPAGFDPNQYVRADKFAEQVTSIPTMLGRLTKISNEHFALFNTPLLDIDTLIADAQASKGKRNVLDIWEEKYKVKDKRAEIEAAKVAAHDKEVADAAVRKYASEHNMPFTAPGRPSTAPLFSSKDKDDVHKPWKNARANKEERRQKMLEAIGGRAPAVQ